MQKSNRSDKGFTLIELIIVISIFSVVLTLGYKIINKVNIETKKQSTVFNEQQATNLVNKYITKDLESSRSIKELQSNELDKYRNKYSSLYGYRVSNYNNEEFEYIVGINDKNYDLIRVENNSEMTLAEDIKISNNITQPFMISIEENENSKQESEQINQNRNLFKVSIYNGDNKYEFNINPRTGNVDGTDIGKPVPFDGEGHIIVNKTLNDKAVIINSRNEKGEYKQEIKVSRNNDGKKVDIDIKDYKLNVVIDSYENGIANGTISVNGEEKKINGIDINRKEYSYFFNDTQITVRKEKYTDRDDEDDNELIIEMNKGNKQLIKLEREEDDEESELEVKLYNREIDIEIDNDGEVEIDIGIYSKYLPRVTTYDIENEIDIEIGKKYISNISGVELKTKYVDIKEVELNDIDYNYFDFIKINPTGKVKLELEIETNNTDENIVMVNFSKDEVNTEFKPLGSNIKVMHVKHKGNDTSLKIVDNNGEIGMMHLGRNSNKVDVQTSLRVVDASRKKLELKVKSHGKEEIFKLTTNKEVKAAKLDFREIKELSINKWEELGIRSVNSGEGIGNTNDEFTIVLFGE